MIQAYLANNKNYEFNGDSVLTPTKCILKAALNGSWVMEMEHPIDPEGRWTYIESEGVISAPTFMGKGQLFRIDDIDRTDTSVSATAYPIFLDAADDLFITDKRPENKNGQEALDILTSGSAYSGKSDIQKISTAYFQRRNLIDAIQGEDEPTFLSRWGGEVLYNNFQVIIDENAGSDRGTEILYGKNMNGISYKHDMSEVVTRIVPVAYNGHTLNDNSSHVDSPLIDKYAKKYIKEIKFENIKLAEDAAEGEEDVVICKDQSELNTALIAACNAQFDAGIDKPKVSIEVNMIDLSHTKEYQKFAALEKICLGDIVKCVHKKTGLSTSAKVTELEWDCIRDRSENIRLGEYKNIADTLRDETRSALGDISSAVSAIEDSADKLKKTLNSVVNKNGDLVAEKIAGIVNANKAMIRALTDIAETQNVRAMLLEDTNPKSPTYGAMLIGSQGFAIASERTPQGDDWAWKTFGSGQGFSADLINAGTMLANRIYGGLLTLGGSNNTAGRLVVKDGSGNDMVELSKDGIRLSNGASLISANGVCGNLQYLSGGGEPAMLGYRDYGGRVGQTVVTLAAFIPENYVINSAVLTLKLAPAYWEDDIMQKTYTGYARSVELKYGNDTSLSISGVIGAEYGIVSTGFTAVPAALLGGFTGKPSGSASSVKEIKSGELKSLLTPGKMTIFEVSSLVTATTDYSGYNQTGAALAVLNVNGYTKN